VLTAIETQSAGAKPVGQPPPSSTRLKAPGPATATATAAQNNGSGPLASRRSGSTAAGIKATRAAKLRIIEFAMPPYTKDR
jgi:hypothetical protein